MISLLLSAVGAVLSGGLTAQALPAAIEQAVLEQEPALLEELQVSCNGVRAGCAERIVLEAEGLMLDPLRISSATISLSSVELLPDGRMRLGGIDWVARISDSELTSALRRDVEDLGDARLQVDEQALHLSGTYPVLRVNVPYELEGLLQVENESQLVFRVSSSGLARFGMPSGLNRLLESEINPVYDLEQFARRNAEEIAAANRRLSYDFQLSITEITNADGHIILTGEA
jgi:hypothetical protein